MSTARCLITLALTLLAGSHASGCARRYDVLALPAPLWSPVMAEQRGEPAAIHAFEERRLRIDQLQLKGSHNSYHKAPRVAVSPSFRYSHASLTHQLTAQGVRHLELDVRYSAGQLRVGHAPIIDGRTSCSQFHACIRAIKRWSKQNPLHVPVFVFVQPKEGLMSAGLDRRLGLLDREINRVFSRHDLLLPTDVARGFPSLRQAVMTVGWPSLDSARGKVAFVLFGQARLVHKYAGGRKRLEGRSMFVANASPGRPYTAILSIDDPVARQADIVHAVQDHLLVRTRADANLVRSVRRRNAAINSGAHFIGSDFVDPRHAWLDIGPEAPARENPMTSARGQSRRVRESERSVSATRGVPSTGGER